jgi:hypothetical protein
MAETIEGKVKRWLYGTTQKPGKLFNYFPGAWVYKPPGGMFGRAGTADCLLCWRGIFVAIEVKAEGNSPTELQLRSLRSINAAGGIGAVLTGKDEFRLAAIRDAVLARIQEFRDEPQSPI